MSNHDQCEHEDLFDYGKQAVDDTRKELETQRFYAKQAEKRAQEAERKLKEPFYPWVNPGVMACPICNHPLMNRAGECGLACHNGHTWILEEGKLVNTTSVADMLEEKIEEVKADPWDAVLEAEKKSCATHNKDVDAHLEVNPVHYTVHSIEPIDVIESWHLGFSLGNVIKYVARAAWKNNKLKDLKKAQWYLNREIERLENE